MLIDWFRFNNSGITRGYPDLSAVGRNVVTIQGGNWQNIDGTSASAPIVGALITLINEQRRATNKSTVGFINPVIYKNPQAFNDVVLGSNPNTACKTQGFRAVKGWDPVTGLGTPDYERLLRVFMALP